MMRSSTFSTARVSTSIRPLSRRSCRSHRCCITCRSWPTNTNPNTVSGIRIRPYRLDDAQAIWDAVRESMRELHPWMPWAHQGYSIDETRSWLGVQVPAFQQRTTFEFAIVAEDGRYLGGCGLN